MPYRQKDSKLWWISFVNSSGKRVRRSSGTTDFQQAKALEKKLSADGYDARKKSNGVSASFDTVLVEYLERSDRLKSRSNVSRARTLADYFRGRSFHDLTKRDIDQYKAHRLKTVSISTINRDLVILSAAVEEYNRRHGSDIPNPAKGAKEKEPESRVRWLTKEEYSRLIACASPEVADLIRLLVYTGMRAQEAYGLEWTRVDFGRGLITLEWLHTKTKKRRTIPIHPEAKVSLDSCYLRNPNHALVFGGTRDRKKGILGALKRAGIQDFHPHHDLRHTFASWLVIAGASLYEVKDLLGHGSIEETQKYAHLAPENLKRAVGLL